MCLASPFMIFSCDRILARVSRPGAIDTSTAVGGQEVDQLVYGAECGAVDPRPPLAFAADQARVLQLLQVEREHCGRQTEAGPNGSGGRTFRAGPHESSEHIQAGFLSQGGESVDGDFPFYISNGIEAWTHFKSRSQIVASIPFNVRL
jgi:hypothetical protein